MENKILIIDDEPDLLKIVVFRLKKAGYRVLTAVDGQQALDIIRSDKPNLILLDVLLPVKDGVTICKIIKDDDTTRQITVILFTAT